MLSDWLAESAGSASSDIFIDHTGFKIIYTSSLRALPLLLAIANARCWVLQVNWRCVGGGFAASAYMHLQVDRHVRRGYDCEGTPQLLVNGSG